MYAVDPTDIINYLKIVIREDNSWNMVGGMMILIENNGGVVVVERRRRYDGRDGVRRSGDVKRRRSCNLGMV